jgi:hypothetical protein
MKNKTIMAKLFKVIVELYDLLITARKNDRFGRVVSTGSLKIDDLIAIAVTRRTDLSAATLKASYEILKEIAIEEVCDAKRMEFGLSHYSLAVKGVFIGDHAAWNAAEDSFCLQLTPTAEIRRAVNEITVKVRGMAQSGIYINTVTDVTTGEVHTCITPGGAVNLSGVKIEIIREPATGAGLFLTEVNSGVTEQISN